MDVGLLLAMSLGYILANAADQYQIVARLNGAVIGKVASGYQLAMEVMLINRIGAAFYFLSTAFFIERSGQVGSYISIIGLSLFVITVMNASLLGFVGKSIQVRNKLIFRRYFSLGIFSIIAFMFGHAGLTVPYIAGFIWPDYRLTFANSGFVLSSVFTLITTLVIDKRLSKAIDNKSDSLSSLVYAVILGRVLGGIILILALLVFKST